VLKTTLLPRSARTWCQTTTRSESRPPRARTRPSSEQPASALSGRCGSARCTSARTNGCSSSHSSWPSSAPRPSRCPCTTCRRSPATPSICPPSTRHQSRLAGRATTSACGQFYTNLDTTNTCAIRGRLHDAPRLVSLLHTTGESRGPPRRKTCCRHRTRTACKNVSTAWALETTQLCAGGRRGSCIPRRRLPPLQCREARARAG